MQHERQGGVQKAGPDDHQHRRPPGEAAVGDVKQEHAQQRRRKEDVGADVELEAGDAHHRVVRRDPRADAHERQHREREHQAGPRRRSACVPSTAAKTISASRNRYATGPVTSPTRPSTPHLTAKRKPRDQPMADATPGAAQGRSMTMGGGGGGGGGTAGGCVTDGRRRRRRARRRDDRRLGRCWSRAARRPTGRRTGTPAPSPAPTDRSPCSRSGTASSDPSRPCRCPAGGGASFTWMSVKTTRPHCLAAVVSTGVLIVRYWTERCMRARGRDVHPLLGRWAPSSTAPSAGWRKARSIRRVGDRAGVHHPLAERRALGERRVDGGRDGRR